MKKLLTGALLAVFLLALAVTPAFGTGADTYPYLTFQDSADLTIVKPASDSESVTAMGLDSNWQKQAISDPQNITWSSSDSNVAYVYPTAGATVTIYTVAEGEATVTASYTCADNSVITCPANVVVERTTNPVALATDVDVTIVGDTGGSGINISKTGQNAVDVPWFSLQDVFGSTFNEDDVLTMDPTAMHALLYTLELEKDDDGYVWGDPGWDWDWVPNNVTVISEGSYVQEIDGDVSGWPTGWKFKVNNVELDAAASIAKITNDDEVDWAFRN